MTGITKLPLEFTVGTGDIVVGYYMDLKTGKIAITVTKNNSGLVFEAGHVLTHEQKQVLKQQVEQTPKAVFKFTDLDLAIKFYSSFFKEEPAIGVREIKENYLTYHQCICA